MKENIIRFIDDKITNADTDRTAWQWKCIFDWAEGYFHASIEACTGSGKSRIGIYAIELLRRDLNDRKVIIVVPTVQLKMQWEKLLKDFKENHNVDVYVVNSLIKREIVTDLLICDEMHRYAAVTFSKIFTQVKYKFMIGLTATMNRLDGKHIFLARVAPIVHKLSVTEAKTRGWISDFKEIHFAIELNGEDQDHYNDLHEKYLKHFRVFDMDFKLMQECMSNKARRTHIANQINQSEQTIYFMAINCMRYIRIIKSWLSEHPVKIEVAVDIINALDRKTLTFSDSTKTADELAEKLPKAKALHSNLSPIERETFRDKEYKTERGAKKKAEEEDWEYKFKHGKHIAQTRVMEKIAGKKLRKHIIHKIIETMQVNTLCTSKMLNEGFDFPGADLGLTLSRSSSTTAYTQQTGRVARLGGADNPIMIHLYIKGTKDERWLQRASANATGVIHTNRIDEIIRIAKGKEELVNYFEE